MTADQDVNDVPGGLTALGPFFAVGTHPSGQRPASPWRPLGELPRPGPALATRIDGARAALAARENRPVASIEPRVAASVVHLGLAARLTSPALGAAALGRPLDMRLGGLWWQDTEGSLLPLSVPAPPAGDQTAGDWDRRLLDELLVPLGRAVGELVPLSPRVLWGNVASATNAAAQTVARQRPDLAGAAWDAARRLFALPQLRTERDPPGPAFRRSSCCLFYRLEPEGPPAVCGDCVLRDRPARG